MTAERAKILEQGITENQHSLFQYIKSKINSIEEAQDVLQDVYYQSVRYLNVIDGIDNLTGWLFTIARNKIIDFYRKKKIAQVSIDTTEHPDVQFKEEWVTHILAEFEDDEIKDIVLSAIFGAIDELPENQKYVFIENVVNGRTLQDIADESKTSLNTILARKRYAVKSLQKQLADIKHFIDEMR